MTQPPPYPATLKDATNLASYQSLADIFRLLAIGDILRKNIKTDLRRQAPAADLSQLSTLWSFPLDQQAPAATVVRAYCRAGTTTGEYTPVAYGATPTSGQIAVAPNGSIVVLASDAPTDIDVEYLPTGGDYVFLSGLAVNPSTGVCALPTLATTPGVTLAWYVNATVGTTVGQKNILVAAAGAPSTGKARLDVAKANLQFATADAVTKADVALYLCSAASVDALLRSTNSTFI